MDARSGIDEHRGSPLSRRRAVGFAVALVATLVLASCGSDSGDEASPGSSPSALEAENVEVIAEGMEAPWSIAFRGETPLVSERDTARVLELDDRGNSREVATIAGVTPMGEGGLLGIAVHEGYLYAYFTASEENRIERYRLTGGPGSLGLGPVEKVLDGLPAAGFHNGGRIAFGPDGMLYVTAGDAGDSISAQDLDSLAGKILRMTPDGRVPVDNPFEGSLVYSYGHRNPQGLTWKGDTLYASEFGQDTWDELNVIEPGGNYGWPEVEGIAGRDGFVDPVQQWAPADASPSGIAIDGETLYIANLRGERLREVPLSDLATSTERFVGEYGRLRDVVTAPDGSLWVLTNNTDGRGDPAAGDDRIIRVPAER